jgi:hypothetical protein
MHVKARENCLDLFEYILVITSVVYALAIAQLLSGVARLSQTDATVRRFLPHTLWVVILFVCFLMFWWAGWEFRAVEWAFPKYLYIMITPIFMFYAASLIIPTLADEKRSRSASEADNSTVTCARRGRNRT